jgi:predicted SAM-dependent methyltransferase
VSLKNISPGRNFFSYAKVQALVGKLIRNRGSQLRSKRVLDKIYLDIGCGPNTHPNFVNLDYRWHPGIDLCWDITSGLPFADGSMKGVFSEHCFEHFTLATALGIFREIRRILAPGGTLRVVVPDAELYLRAYVSHMNGNATNKFPFEEEERLQATWTPLQSVNRVFYQDRESPFGHQTMYDFLMLEKLLAECGFSSVTRCEFGTGRDAALLVDSGERRVESLYVEAMAS